MEQTTIDQLKYPIGPFGRIEQSTPAQIEQLIRTIEEAPAKYRAIAQNLSDELLQRSYRPGSWTVKQLIHHVADIQLVHFLRMKKALTETDYRDVTLINMDGWVTTADVLETDIADSLDMLESLTRRYVMLLRSLTDTQLAVEYYHPVRKYSISQAQAIGMSAWHLQHHLAHIRIAIEAD